jgi:hypothetical protein
MGIKRYNLNEYCYEKYMSEDEEGEYFKVEDIEEIFNNFEFPQMGDDNYIDGFNRAYELLNEMIFGR